MIQRNILQKLHSTLTYFPVTGIIGPRQVGKTTLSRIVAENMNKDCIYIDLENPKDISKLTDPVLFFETQKEKCIILDEIQRRPELFPIIRSMVDAYRTPGRFLILGSAAPELIRDSSESLAGRIAYIELYPFNIIELGSDYRKISNHWLRGGFPDAYLAPTNEITMQWHYNFIKTYVERDLPLLGLEANRNIISRLWQMIAHLHGNILNMSMLGKSLGLSSPTIKKYLSFLEQAFLIRQLQPHYPNMKKRLVKSPKIYIRDTGILHNLLNIQNQNDLLGHPILGSSWEGYVIEQIIQILPDNFIPYFYRTQQGSEFDLILVSASKVVMGIEIKYSSAPKISKGLLQSMEDLQTIDNYIIIPQAEDYKIHEKITVCSLYSFLQKFTTL
ncbi:MAG: ATP-binding protein [Bacteroidales bacterium]|nr:ATP-binding protein [Bacteroidales bacterium]